MAEDRKAYMIKDDNLGEVRIADEVIAIIAGLAATEAEGVQERVKSAIENMTGLEVSSVNVSIASVEMEKQK